MERMTLAIDVACQVVLQASLADASCRLAGSGRRLRTTAAGLDRLRESLPAGIELNVVTEPTRSVRLPMAAWFPAITRKRTRPASSRPTAG